MGFRKLLVAVILALCSAAFGQEANSSITRIAANLLAANLPKSLIALTCPCVSGGGIVEVDSFGPASDDTPIERSTKELVIATTLNKYGFWMESKVFRNNGTLIAPLKGPLMRTYKTNIGDDTRDISGSKYQYHAQQTDAITHEKRLLAFDNGNEYRKIAETYVTQMGGTSVNVETSYVYSLTFNDGRIPSMITVAINGKQAVEATAVSFDRESGIYVMRTKSLLAGGSEKLNTFHLNQDE
jgi:hypothetical protein